MHTDGDIINTERSIIGLRTEGQVPILCASPKDATFGEFHRLASADHPALGHVVAFENEGNLAGTHDADGNGWLFGSER